MSTYSKCTSGQLLQQIAKQQQVYQQPVSAVRCPDCDKNYDVVFSRKALTKPLVFRMLFAYYRCRVCDYRFSEPKLLLNVSMLGSVLALTGALAWLVWA